MREENQAYKDKQHNLEIMSEIDEAISSEYFELLLELNEFKSKYQANVHFSGKRDFEEVLHQITHSLAKVSNLRKDSIVTTAHLRRSSRKFLVEREFEKAERNLEINLDQSFRNLDFIFEKPDSPYISKIQKKNSRKASKRRFSVTLPKLRMLDPKEGEEEEKGDLAEEEAKGLVN